VFTKLTNGLLFGCMVLGAISAQAGTIEITPNFGSGSGVTGFVWPGTSAPSGSTTGVVLGSPFQLDLGAILITGSASLECAVGTTAGTCGSGSPSSTTAVGLGVGNGRVDFGETITLTVQPGFNVTSVLLKSFSLDGFTSDGAAGGGAEVATFVRDGGSTETFTATGASTATPKTDSPNESFTNTLSFGVQSGGNYSLYALDLVITTANTPEPATFGLAGLALVGLGLVRGKIRK